jgi:hypothetical protein
MPESGTFGSVRGVPGNGHPYRDQTPEVHAPLEHRATERLMTVQIVAKAQ